MVKKLQSLYERIEDAVETLFTNRSIDARHPTIIDFEAYPEGLRQLLERLAGVQDEKASQRLGWLNRMQALQRLHLDTFLRALVMAAVVEWVLDSSLLGQPEVDFCGAMLEELKKGMLPPSQPSTLLTGSSWPYRSGPSERSDHFCSS